jgi:hypothetical protein
VVVGVHTPEFSIERDVANVRRAAEDLGVGYPVAFDNDYAVWDAFTNRYWPAVYIADSAGRIRYRHFGEGAYDRTEEAIRRMLGEAGAGDLPPGRTTVDPRGLEVPADWDNVRSPETYVGLARSAGFVSPAGPLDEPWLYAPPPVLDLNEWGLGGTWTLGGEAAVLNEPSGVVTHRFHARDLNLVLAPSAREAPVRFRVRLDGRPPGDAHGADVDHEGYGVVTEPRLYQMIRQPSPIETRLFEIEFFDRGAAVFCFTFG